MKRSTRDLEQGIGRLSAGSGGSGRNPFATMGPKLNRKGKTTGRVQKLEDEDMALEAGKKLGPTRGSYDMGAGEYSSHISEATKHLLPKKFKKGGMVRGRCDYAK